MDDSGRHTRQDQLDAYDEEKALRQAARFSWQQTAQQTLEVYKLVGLVHEPPLRSGI